MLQTKRGERKYSVGRSLQPSSYTLRSIAEMVKLTTEDEAASLLDDDDDDDDDDDGQPHSFEKPISEPTTPSQTIFGAIDRHLGLPVSKAQSAVRPKRQVYHQGHETAHSFQAAKLSKYNVQPLAFPADSPIL